MELHDTSLGSDPLIKTSTTKKFGSIVNRNKVYKICCKNI